MYHMQSNSAFNLTIWFQASSVSGLSKILGHGWTANLVCLKMCGVAACHWLDHSAKTTAEAWAETRQRLTTDNQFRGRCVSCQWGLVQDRRKKGAKLEQFLGKRKKPEREKKDSSIRSSRKREGRQFGSSDLPPLSGSQCSGFSLCFSWSQRKKMHFCHNWEKVCFKGSSFRGCYLLVLDNGPLVPNEIESKVTSNCVSCYATNHLETKAINSQ